MGPKGNGDMQAEGEIEKGPKGNGDMQAAKS